MNPNLQQRYAETWRRSLASQDRVPPFAEFVLLYSKNHRAHRSMAHIEDCFDEFDEVRDDPRLKSHAVSMELAMLYQNAKYLRSGGSRLASANFAKATIVEAGLSNIRAFWVSELILNMGHLEEPLTIQGKFLADIDAAIFGQSTGRFDDFERQVRQEHGLIPDKKFKPVRLDFFKSLLARPTVYYTPHFQAKYEDKAHENLTAAIAALELVMEV